jgi:adenylate cyclase
MLKAETQLADATQPLLQAIRQDPHLTVEDWLDPSIQTEIENEVRFELEDIDADAVTKGIDSRTAVERADLNQNDANRMHRVLDWHNAHRTLAKDTGLVTSVEDSLRAQVADRLVFIGWTATGTLADFVPTAAGPRTPGVMVHAALADMVLQDRSLFEGEVWWSAVAAACLGVLIAVLVASLGPWPATASAMGVFLVWFLSVVLLFWKADVVLPVVSPLLAITLSWAAGTGSRAIMVQQEKRRITRQFRARVPEALVDELARDPESIGMRGVRREVCVMFGDLAGFTGISEGLESEETVAVLNRCMSGLAEQLTEHHGYVNKFLGDGFLAFWSAFGDQPEQADLACHAAMKCQAFMNTINKDATPGTPALGLRIGIATGEALVGDCGAPPRLNDYTVIGDVANLAARLESANKLFGTSILLDGRTQELIRSDDLPLCEVGPIQVIGREGVVHVWTLAAESLSLELCDAASSLAAAIRGGDRSTARATLETLERLEGASRWTQLLAEVVRDAPDPMPRALRLREK